MLLVTTLGILESCLHSAAKQIFSKLSWMVYHHLSGKHPMSAENFHITLK